MIEVLLKAQVGREKGKTNKKLRDAPRTRGVVCSREGAADGCTLLGDDRTLFRGSLCTANVLDEIAQFHRHLGRV